MLLVMLSFSYQSLTISSLVTVISVSVAAFAAFLLVVLWLICRKRAGEFSDFRSHFNDEQTHQVQTVCIIETWIMWLWDSQTEVYSSNANLRELSSQTTIVSIIHLNGFEIWMLLALLEFSVLHVCFIINTHIIWGTLFIYFFPPR